MSTDGILRLMLLGRSDIFAPDWNLKLINLFFGFYIFNDSCCYVHCCVTSLSIFMTSLLHTHSVSAVERIVSLDTEGTETESSISISIFTSLRRIVNCI